MSILILLIFAMINLSQIRNEINAASDQAAKVIAQQMTVSFFLLMLLVLKFMKTSTIFALMTVGGFNFRDAFRVFILEREV